MRRSIFILGGILLVGWVLPASAGDEPVGWQWEAGLLAGDHDNFFFRGGGAGKPGSNLLTGYLAGELERDTGPGEVTFAIAGQAVSVLDIDNADYQALSAAVAYKRGRIKVQGELSTMLNRLYSEEGDAVFFDQQSADLWVRYSVGPRLWLRLGVELESADFDPAENDRDADSVKADLTARFALSERLGLRLSLLSEERDAIGARNSRSGEGWAIALEAQPRDDVDLFLRLRSRDRSYEDAPPGDRNFNREDTIEDATLNLRWRASRRWGLQLRDTHRSGDSTRADRNFTGNQVELGVFVGF